MAWQVWLIPCCLYNVIFSVYGLMGTSQKESSSKNNQVCSIFVRSLCVHGVFYCMYNLLAWTLWLFNWFPHVVPEHLQVKNGCLEGKRKHAMNIFPLWLVASDAVVIYKEANEGVFSFKKSFSPQTPILWVPPSQGTRQHPGKKNSIHIWKLSPTLEILRWPPFKERDFSSHGILFILPFLFSYKLWKCRFFFLYIKYLPPYLESLNWIEFNTNC